MNARATFRPHLITAIVSILAVLRPASSPADIGPAWQSLGPAPIGGVEYTGRISAIATDPADASRYFVAGADGGVWRTLDAGLTWSPLTDAMPTTAMGALAIDPTDLNVIYAGTGEANFAFHSRPGVGILKSTDGGSTWATFGGSSLAGRCISRIVIDPSAPHTLYAAVTPAGGFNPPMSAAKGHPQAADPVGVYKSTDGGQTWSILTNGIPALAATDIAIQPGSPLTLFAAIGHIFGNAINGVYRSLDGGASWVRLSGGLPANVGRVSLAIAPSMPQRVFAAIVFPADANGGNASTLGLYRSDNAGLNWTLVSTTGYQATYGWYLNTVTVQPTNPNVVFVGGLNLLRSTTAGTSMVDVTPPHVDLHALEWDASGRLLAGDDGGLHRTQDMGVNWIPLNTGLGLIQFYSGLSLDPVSTAILYGGTQDNGTNKRDTTGTWSHIFGGDGGVTGVNPLNASNVFCEFQGTGNFYRSTNAGAGFNISNTGIVSSDRNCFLPPYEIDPTDPNRLIYGTHRVYQSTNNGVTWAAISPSLTATATGAIRSLAIAPSNPQCIWVTTNDGHVQVTFNGGTQWNLVRTGLPGWGRVMRQVFVDPVDHLHAYLAGSQYNADQVLRTIDGGANWSALDGDLPDIPVNVIAVDTRPAIDILFAGAEDGAYRSVDGGATWHRFGQSMPRAAVIDLRLDTPRNRLVASTQGRGAWQLPIWLPGDINADGAANELDIIPFVDALLGMPADPDTLLRADLNADGAADGLDVQPLVNSLE